MIKENSVVQINESGQEGWIGCLVQVKSWGIQDWVKIPMQGEAYIRVKNGEFDYIGEAVMIHGNQVLDEEDK